MDTASLAKLCERTFLSEAIYLKETTSTNSEAIKRIQQESLRFPAIIVTEKQTAGRGRGKNKWWSTSGALTFSLLIDPQAYNIPKEKWAFISLGAALSVAKIIDHSAPASSPCQLKWPNDVYLNDQKIAGILLEVAIGETKTPAIVIGMGININNSFQDAPAELKEIGTSLVDQTGNQTNRLELLEKLLYDLEILLASFKTEPESFINEWRSRCWLRDKMVTIQNGEHKVTGICQSIDDDGALLLSTELGLQRFHGGVIQSVENI